VESLHGYAVSNVAGKPARALGQHRLTMLKMNERLQWAALWASRETLAFGTDEQRVLVFQGQIRGRIAAVRDLPLHVH
jgi:hypothetical protein